jgi:hypothetical protein
VPETLSAAMAAAQANVDHVSSGDFAGVCERMSREVRDGITQEDFVTVYQTCKNAGPKNPKTHALLASSAGPA